VQALADRYTVERELGHGGMATVYLARDLRHERLVALKVVRPELAQALGPDRFLQEIRLAARLQHPHLLSVHDSGEAAGRLWFTMPYVEGTSLRERLRREQQLPLDDALRIAHEAARALDYAHRHGVLHRDIKPENILLTEDGDTLVADFGVGRAIGAADEDERLTEGGMIVGTPAYMSPEQAAGERELDGRSDVYALGCVLYEMLAGEPPFVAPTPHALIIRRLTETPRPLAAVRDTVPRAVEAITTRALARAPADRFTTAGAMADALESARLAGRTDETVAVPPARPRRRWVGPAVLLAAALAAAGGLLLRSRSAEPGTLDPSLVAVAPFDVLDPALALWREGLVDLLSRNLDGAGPLRTVPPTTVIRRWQGRADPESAAELGRRTGAGLALYGSVLGAGRDSVRLRATLFDVVRQRAIDEWETADEAGRVDRAADSLTLRVLQSLGRTRAIGAAKMAPFGSTSLPALKAFLQGEQFFRHTDWDSAYAYYDRAIALDSSFAPALRRAGAVLGWSRSGFDSLANVYALRAGVHNHGLPPRDSLLISGDSLLASLLQAGRLALQADSGWASRLHRLFETAEASTRRYPDDPESWYLLGEADQHLGPYARRPGGEALTAFDHAIALDSAFAPAYLHPMAIASADGIAAMRPYLERYLALDPREEEADGARLVKSLTDSGVTAAVVPRLTWGVPGATLFSAQFSLGNLADSAELGVALARVLASRPPSDIPLERRGMVGRFLSRTLMSRGHLGEAYAALRGQDTTWPFADLALVGGVPAGRGAAVFHDRLGEPMSPELIQAFPWWAVHRDTISLLKAQTRADSAAGRGATPTDRVVGRYAAGSAAAYLALARGDTATALARFLALPDDWCPSCYLDRLTTAQLLAARSRDAEAWAILRADHVSATLAPFATTVLWVLLRGQVSERLGDRETALRSYGWVAGMWRHADPPLQPYVSEAREGLGRLSAEPR
jgi:eukaryotic-like serine/threonine-protein kinase